MEPHGESLSLSFQATMFEYLLADAINHAASTSQQPPIPPPVDQDQILTESLSESLQYNESTMSLDVGQVDDNISIDDDKGENPVQPVDEDDDNMEGVKDTESMVGHTNTYQNYHDPAQIMDADEDEDGAADISYHDMEVTPDKMAIESKSDDNINAHPKKIHAPKPKQNNSDTAKVSPPKCL